MAETSASERFALFLKELENAPRASSHDEAFRLLCETLNAVEDALSGVPYNPEGYLNDGRLYPPQNDSRRSVSGRSDLVRYRARRHNVWISSTGAIRIDTAGDARRPICCLSKPGADGVHASIPGDGA